MDGIKSIYKTLGMNMDIYRVIRKHYVCTNKFFSPTNLHYVRVLVFVEPMVLCGYIKQIHSRRRLGNNSQAYDDKNIRTYSRTLGPSPHSVLVVQCPSFRALGSTGTSRIRGFGVMS